MQKSVSFARKRQRQKPYHEFLKQHGIETCNNWRQQNLSPGPGAAYNVPVTFEKYGRFVKHPVGLLSTSEHDVFQTSQFSVLSKYSQKSKYLASESLYRNNQKRKLKEKLARIWKENQAVLDQNKVTPGPADYIVPMDNLNLT